MKNNITEVVFILDKSGSMHGLEGDTIGGFNSMLESQKKVEGQALVTTVLFSGISKTIHDRVDIQEVAPLTEKDYIASGSTALIDTIGETIDRISAIHRYIRKEDVPDKVIFFIITDGMENASHNYTSDQVKKTIEAKKELGWNFMFLGANIDSVETAKDYGIDAEYACDYEYSCKGVRKNYDSLDRVMCCMRENSCIPKDWKEIIAKPTKNPRDKSKLTNRR